MFSVNTNNLPSAPTSYAAALQLHDSIKPNREGKKPLGKMRRGEFWIQRDTQENIHLIYHRTSVITHHPDNTLTLDTTYNSNNTRAVANALLPHPFGVFIHASNQFISTQEEDYPANKPLIIDLNTYTLNTKQQIEVRYVDKEKAKGAQKVLQMWKKFVTAATQLQPGYYLQLRDSATNSYTPTEEQLTHPDILDPDYFIPTIIQPYIRYTYTNQHNFFTYLTHLMYVAHDVYYYAPQPLGTLPSKSQTWRVKEN